MIVCLFALRTPSDRHSRLLLGLVSTLATTLALHGQGALFPPSDPAPTMRTLDQVEPRTMVNATNTPGDDTSLFVIRSSGSYYLTGNIAGASGKHGIAVVANNVTLDLNGFALIGPEDSGIPTRGVNTITPIVNFSIRNGNVSGWTDGGVRADFAVTRAEKLSLSNNTGSTGLTVGSGSLVTDCVARGNGTGIRTADHCQVMNCIATDNSVDGFESTNHALIADCTSSRNGRNGIVTAESSVARCMATDNGDFGIQADSSSVSHCTVRDNHGWGIAATNGVVAFCLAKGNAIDSVFGLQISADGATRTGNNPAP